MGQTLAIFYDAYRELNSKRMFWVVLALSVILVVALASLGLTPHGVTLFGYPIRSYLLNSVLISKPTLYKVIFSNFGVGLWLGWVAIILALISTASLFPDFLTGGSIDLYLSKPIGRLRLFLIKYLSGLLFAALQVSIFCLGSFLVLGIRGDAWVPSIFLTIPVVVCLFSYLFAVCVLLGMLTRSTVAALLLTLTFWLLISAVDLTVNGTRLWRSINQSELGRAKEQVAHFDADLAGFERIRSTATDPTTLPTGLIDGLRKQRDADARSVADLEATAATVRRAYSTASAVKALLPKTGDTAALMERWLVARGELPEVDPPQFGWGNAKAEEKARDRLKAQREVKAAQHERPASWILGTSLAFEAVVLAWAAWLFCRRDF